MEINIKNNLPLDILFLIRIKAKKNKNEGIHEIDPDSFFVVTDAYEVFGGE